MESRHPSSSDLHQLVARALDGDQQAWRDIVDRLRGVAWKVLNSYDIPLEERKDAFASTFFRLYERLGTIREPEKLPGWIATTARNEANTAYRRTHRVVPMADLPMRSVDLVDHGEGMERAEMGAAVLAAFSRLPPKLQHLMRLLTADPPIGYDEISRVLDLPHGSIGPMRQRCLQRLRNSPELAPFLDLGSD